MRRGEERSAYAAYEHEEREHRGERVSSMRWGPLHDTSTITVDTDSRR